MAYTEITAIWSGFSGAPGYTRMKFNGDLDAAGATSAAGRVRAFFFAFSAVIPTGVSISFQSTARIFDVAGRLTGEVSFTAPGSVAGAGTGNWSGASGAVVNWLTSSYHNGRRVRGRTFLVPLAGIAYGTDGTLSSTALDGIRPAAATLVSGTPELVVAGGFEGGGGYVYNVTSSSVPDLAAVLRSRRD